MTAPEHAFCGQAWTSAELLDAGFDDYTFNEQGVAKIPHLPTSWPRCPMCDSPLRRIKDGPTWRCEPRPPFQQLEEPAP